MTWEWWLCEGIIIAICVFVLATLIEGRPIDRIRARLDNLRLRLPYWRGYQDGLRDRD
ncbi:hypothetical protein [Mycobacterium malmoense]|uniref:hypothetical protein n=1 Tax=Mycobacterium malmoense TaxID=1780 RepID=UPI00159EEAAA|nr:hypothetical protein [Mycobacterium malmoense]